jgi:photosystem II stability/assembly factor-like uncharacterized protein
MKKIFFSLLFITLNLIVQAQWISSTISPSSNPGDNFYDLDFTPNNTGWAVQFYPGRIYNSTNNGQTWKPNYNAGNSLLKTVHFINNNQGVVAGSNLTSNTPIIYNTNNGGVTWTTSTILSGSSTTNKSINFISSSNNSTIGFAFGNNGIGLYSPTGINGTWYDFFTPTTSHIWSAYIVNSDTLFIASDNLYMKTQFSGFWSIVYNGAVDDIDFISKDTGFAITGSKMIKTVDGGLSWNIISSHSLPNTGILQLKALSKNEIYISGSDREIFISTNGGVSWTSDLSFLIGHHITRLKVNQGKIWATGWNGLIMSKDLITVNLDELITNYSFSFYPNPSTDNLNIKSEVLINEINILDITGKLIKTIKLNTSLINIEDLKEGIYFLKIITSTGESNTYKFIKN